MGVDSRRPPLPAPTESTDENSPVETELATNLTARTDKTSYEIPEDGSPITISTQKLTGGKELGRSTHHRQKSQTSLLIEYFEGSKTGDKVKSRPSVRVKVTPSATKKGRHGGHDAIQITNIGKDRKASYTRRISLSSSKNVETGLAPGEGTEISHSSESNVSARPPIEIEVLNHNGSDMSNGRSSRGLLYAQNESNVSSMPPDSMLEGSRITDSDLSRDLHHDDDITVTEEDHLKAPADARSRSASHERLAQKVVEKLGQGATRSYKGASTTRDRSYGKEYDDDDYDRERRRHRSHYPGDDSTISGNGSSMLSYRSGSSQASRLSNNPRLLEVVEQTIKRVIMPELRAIKEDQRADRNLRSFDSGRTTIPKDGYESPTLERRVSKSSSTPHLSSKPKVVLNREGDDPGTVLSRGDSERQKIRKSSREYMDRPSSRRSSGTQSQQGDGYDEEGKVRRKSSRSSHGLRDAAAAGMAGGILTAAALKSHDSQSDTHERRKKRNRSHGSRSRSTSIAETNDEAYGRQEEIPPLPMASRINDSDVTRESILSTSTERPSEIMTPIREVSRGSVGDAMSPVSGRTPTRTPVSGSRGLGMSHTNYSIDSPTNSISGKARMAGLAAAGLGGLAAAEGVGTHHHDSVDADGYGETMSRRGVASPAQSVSSLKKQFEEEESLVPQGLRPKSAASRSSAGRLREARLSPNSIRSSPTTQRLAASRQQSQNVSGDEFITPLERPDASFMRETTPGTPTGGESIDEWYERQHQVNDRYRHSLGEATNRDSYQTNPFPEDDRRFTRYTDDSFDEPVEEVAEDEQNVKGVGANPIFQQPAGIESNVASLMEPSTISSNMRTSEDSPVKSSGTYASRMAMADKLRELDKEGPPAMYEGSTLSQTMPSPDRWAAIKAQVSGANSRENVRSLGSPHQSPARSLREQPSAPVMGASGLPVADDPLPEIGHYDDTKSEISTNPSIIHGPLGGDITGKDTWPYTPEPESAKRELATPGQRSLRGTPGKGDGLFAAAAGGAAALAAAHAAKQPTVEDEHALRREYSPVVRHAGKEIDREATPTGSPAAFRDEGYATDVHGRSTDAITPQPRYSKEDMEDYQRAMDAHDDDPFTTTDVKHARHVSGNSHGIASPLYDSATGKGINGIQSKDIVALMDHLTVRDAQRNARDTEILVTLVRNAAELRQSFDEMKQFIKDQDRLIMANTDRDAEQLQKVLSGPRPQPPGTPRTTPRRDTSSQEDVQAKRKGVLRRALKGLTGGRRADDLAKFEGMLMEILENVEDLKHGGVSARQPTGYTNDTNDTLDSYAKLRAAPDSGYEPEGHAGTSSTPSHSGDFETPPRIEKHQFHSGYDGRRGSVNRVSTVMEGDEDEELTPDEDHLLHHQFENNERMLTPTQETIRDQRGQSPNDTPYHGAERYADGNGHTAELTPKTADKQRKHKSNSSSIFGFGGGPKISRWSKTTSSSAAPDRTSLDSPNAARGVRPLSAASRSRSQIDKYDDEDYDVHPDDRLRSTQSLARDQQRPVSQAETRSMRSQASKITRTPSPLVPSEASVDRDVDYRHREASPVQYDDEHEFDDPKYQAHRNSLLLQHPQPRQGPTGRHQNKLETQAEDFDDPSGTNSDVSQRTTSDFDPTMWGSSGTAALARNRLSQAEPMSPASGGGYGGTTAERDEGPLIPQQKPQSRIHETVPESDWEPTYSNSGFSKGGYYASPYGSGHLLEPIEEVRYSLETDSGHLSPEPQTAQAVDMRHKGRKITGPRPMGRTRSPVAPQARIVEHNNGTVRRKPVAKGTT
ncbi:hypothetical protein BAUCODRAFT_78130 [Baudoinia panamericana UAMH 10762]|uniref:Uncharacterized protein n=1 Tax=Baudoinia panamericana (strain UAMH 10762) TaxID=717646 RepID=M2M7R6_BAUPA|nr:uncharacterized protein BAUCODRAFT_78130 [Baudoinia panamericana UAMH 10762]EMC92371.1 hypothetical protein BAUCODRAFT_78130 [Baudoinia panamericana UAMH 10762]